MELDNCISEEGNILEEVDRDVGRKDGNGLIGLECLAGSSNVGPCDSLNPHLGEEIACDNREDHEMMGESSGRDFCNMGSREVFIPKFNCVRVFRKKAKKGVGKIHEKGPNRKKRLTKGKRKRDCDKQETPKPPEQIQR